MTESLTRAEPLRCGKGESLRPPRAAMVQGASRGIGLELARHLLSRSDFDRVYATCRSPETSAGLKALSREHPGRVQVLRVDVAVEESVARAAAEIRASTPHLQLIVNCAGVLHEEGGIQPEKRLESVDPDAMRRAFDVNALGPLLVAKHLHPLLRHGERAVLANLSARVGSIGDDRAGGWYAYRGSKAAQNMFTKNIAIELGRRAPRCICVALHPGTVETELSRPFRRGVPPEKLFTGERAARQLLAVIDGLEPEDSGGFFAWDGSPIPW